MIAKRLKQPLALRAGVAALAVASILPLLKCERCEATPSEQLQEAVRKWRTTRAYEPSVDVYLRPIIEEDAAFNPDPGLALEHLSANMRQIYDGLQLLLSPSLTAQFLGLSSDSLRSEWVRRYWRLRDPTPTTPENERRLEHERRVDRAQRDFAQNAPPGWDARGDVLIRCGDPDSVLTEGADIRIGVGFVPAREDWLYFDSGWVAEFQRPNPKGPWLLGRPSPPLSSRPDLVQDERRKLGFEPPPGADQTALGRDRTSDLLREREERILLSTRSPLDETLSDELIQHEIRTDLGARELLRRRVEAAQLFGKEYAAGTERFHIADAIDRSLWYVFDVDVFKGPPGRMRVEVHYQFNLQDLAFHWQDSLYVAQYRVEGVLLDRRVRESARDEYTQTVKAAEFHNTMAAELIPGQLNFIVSPGNYRLALRFADVQQAREGTYVTDVSVPDLSDGQLAISDLEMATKIIYAGDDWRSRFVKNDRLVVPNPIGVVRRGRELTGYFEVYGLRLDPHHNVCRYRVTYAIQPRGTRRDDGWLPDTAEHPKPFVSATFDGEARASELVEELRIDVSGLDQDVYDVVLTVRDLLAGSQATTRAAFSLLDQDSE